MAYSDENFVLDPAFAHWVWEQIRASARLKWPDDEKLIYHLNAQSVSGGERYFRDGTWDKDEDGEWYQLIGRFAGPKMTMWPHLEMQKSHIRDVYMAATAYTTLGSWYTFEIQEERDGPVVFEPIRVPVPRELRDEVYDWAEGNGGEVFREKGVEFQERYAEVLSGDKAARAAGDLYDLHVRIPGVESESEAKEIVEQANSFAERGVRMVS